VTVFKHIEDSLGVIVKRMVGIEVETGGDPNGVTVCAAEKVVRL
jgi:hypothetical protein